MSVIADYVDSRVRPRIAWYDRKAVQYKRVYLLTQYLTVAASIGVLLFLHLESTPRFFIASLAALAALLTSVEKIGQFGHLWRSYRLNAESLQMELQLHSHGSGVYAVEENARNRLLVERAEEIMAREAGDWRLIVSSGTGVAEETKL